MLIFLLVTPSQILGAFWGGTLKLKFLDKKSQNFLASYDNSDLCTTGAYYNNTWNDTGDDLDSSK